MGTRVTGPAAPTAPLVTIVVPVYNGERFLRESVDSVLAQTYPRVEVLVMDDASTDGTADILTGYGEAIRYHRQARNRGQFDNVNDGIAQAAGAYVGVFHADDVYEPTIVEREVEFLERFPEAGAVFSQDVFIDAAGRAYGRLAIPPDVPTGRPLEYATLLDRILTYKNTFLPTPTALVRASVYREVGGYRGAEYRIAADLEMWLRIARRYPIGLLPEYLMRYRHFHGNSTQSHYHMRTQPEGHFRILDEALADGGAALVRPEALAAHEAHRAEDALLRAATHYILDQRGAALDTLREARARRLLASPRVQRGRLALLWAGLHALCRLPRIAPVAAAFYQRWHVKASPLDAA